MRDASSNFQVHVLIRFSKKTGKIDTTMTGLGSALMRMWALQNTTSSKECIVINRSTGDVVFHTIGTKDGFPKVADVEDVTSEDFGISYEELQTFTDDRFDNNGEFQFLTEEK